jgi:hypothetical protein
MRISSIFPGSFRRKESKAVIWVESNVIRLWFTLTLNSAKTMNMTLGYALLRDRRVPIRTKLIALGIGAAGVGAFELLQLPVEGVVAALLPLIGAAGDLALDGAEAVIGPVLIATLLLPHLAPADLVQQIRAETERMAHA